MYSAAFEDAAEADFRNEFRQQLHQFVGLCQCLVLPASDRAALLPGIIGGLVGALPVPGCAADFFLLRSILVEFVLRALQANGRSSDEVLPLARISPTSANLADALVRCLSGALHPPMPSTMRDVRAERAMAVIGTQCCDPGLRSHTIARSVGISPTRLARLLRTHYGCTFPSARRRARIEIVKAQLQSSNDSIKEIAARAGYSSTSQLDRDFRTECGVAPALYRRRRSVFATATQLL
jgi:AraC-like DNA-binding protein